MSTIIIITPPPPPKKDPPQPDGFAQERASSGFAELRRLIDKAERDGSSVKVVDA